MRSLLSPALIVLSIVLGACTGIIERRAADSTYSIMKGSRLAMQRTSDVELARTATPGGLVQLEAFHLAYPRHRGFLSLLTEGYCQYAVGFVHSDWEQSVQAHDPTNAERQRQRALSLYERCTKLGLQLLGTRWEEAQAEDQLMSRIDAATKRDVPGMVWVALGMVNTIALDPFKPQRLKELSLVDALLKRSIALDEGFDDAIAHMMLGALASSRPRFLGGDPEAGKAHFEQARTLTGGGMLMIDVVFARTYGVATANRELFRQTLESVIATDPSAWPERRLANTLAIEKARGYLMAEDAYFGIEAEPEPGDATSPTSTAAQKVKP